VTARTPNRSNKSWKTKWWTRGKNKDCQTWP